MSPGSCSVIGDAERDRETESVCVCVYLGCDPSLCLLACWNELIKARTMDDQLMLQQQKKNQKKSGIASSVTVSA